MGVGMKKDRLAVVKDRDVYRLVWDVWNDALEEWEEGLGVGEKTYRNVRKPPTDLEEWEDYTAVKSIKSEMNPERDSHGYWFETQKEAREARRIAVDAIKTGDKPWPAWAIEADKAGWKPPKGWKP
ncbi:MAG: hypothetical protein ACXABY_11285 [Candidatus Thorarchaeota archaeon]|jgi:hypothetical protein